MAQLETKSIVEGALFSAIIVILALLAFYLPPVVGTVLIFTLPAPIVVLSVRQGTKISILATVLSAIILGIVMNPLMILIVLFGFGLTGIVLGAAFEEEFSPNLVITIAIIVSIISTALTLGANLYLFNLNPLTMIDQGLEYLELEQATNQQLEELITYMKEMISNFLPGLLLTASSVNGLINYYVVTAVLSKLGYDYQKPRPFVKWNFPGWLVLGYLGGILFIDTMVGKNIYFIFSFIFLIQGLAVAAYYLKNLAISNLAQKIILLFLFLLPTNQILVVVGLLDSWFNYRELEE
ncbi:MAG: DUF2232 domain-containing protein [Bacillota bacterium]